MKCPLCKSTAKHIREEKEVKHCRKCGQKQEFFYHTIISPVDGTERRLFCHHSEIIEHLAVCQPELLKQAGISVRK